MQKTQIGNIYKLTDSYSSHDYYDYVLIIDQLDDERQSMIVIECELGDPIFTKLDYSSFDIDRYIINDIYKEMTTLNYIEHHYIYVR